MATIDTLASLNEVPRANLHVLIVDGLTSAQEYNIYRRSSDSLWANLCEEEEAILDRYVFQSDQPSYWSGDNPITADTNGRIVIFHFNMVADDSMNENGGLSIHDNVLPSQNSGTVASKTNAVCFQPPADRRLEGVLAYPFSTGEILQPLDPWYVTVDNLVATPGTGEVQLDWDAGTKLDAGRGSIEYTVLRRSTAGSPGPTDILIDGLTSTSYLDTTPADGITYRYRIHARLYWDGFLPYAADGYLPYDDFWGGLDMSNIEEVTLGAAVPAVSMRTGGAPRI